MIEALGEITLSQFFIGLTVVLGFLATFFGVKKNFNFGKTNKRLGELEKQVTDLTLRVERQSVTFEETLRRLSNVDVLILTCLDALLQDNPEMKQKARNRLVEELGRINLERK